ncbi:hypothetical protein RchiOBHm_Chr4g0397061 [Rosa chinensis]|uniref:Uncharacterized protein n=1 Tax=Rosa chinensis TaxID=74649 RepID=A0A2P6QRY9_ROSCH|nr:hypothetical protein RchiOBHm_Chr4g0397061 [Rosa chinensis]
MDMSVMKAVTPLTIDVVTISFPICYINTIHVSLLCNFSLLLASKWLLMLIIKCYSVVEIGK